MKKYFFKIKTENLLQPRIFLMTKPLYLQVAHVSLYACKIMSTIYFKGVMKRSLTREPAYFTHIHSVMTDGTPELINSRSRTATHTL